jgi:flagellar protein FliL
MNTYTKLAGVLLSVLLLASSAFANEGGGKEGGKDGLHAKIEAITVNIQGSKQYVQVEIVLALAKDGLDEKIKKYMPVIRNGLILLLTSRDINQLESPEGKMKLTRDAMDVVNAALGTTEKDGVTDVLFDSFIIQ